MKKTREDKIFEAIDDFWNYLDDLWWSLLTFIFGTKVGHVVFIVVFVMTIVALLSLVFKFIDIEVLIGAFLGSLVAGIYFAIKDKTQKWL